MSEQQHHLKNSDDKMAFCPSCNKICSTYEQEILGKILTYCWCCQRTLEKESLNILSKESEAELPINDILAEKYVRFQQHLKKLKSLENNWDSYKAKKPNNISVKNAQTFLEFCFNSCILPNKIGALAEGGISLEFKIKSIIYLIDFYNYGEIIYLKEKNDNHETEQIFFKDFKKIINMIKEQPSNILSLESKEEFEIHPHDSPISLLKQRVKGFKDGIEDLKTCWPHNKIEKRIKNLENKIKIFQKTIFFLENHLDIINVLEQYGNEENWYVEDGQDIPSMFLPGQYYNAGYEPAKNVLIKKIKNT